MGVHMHRRRIHFRRHHAQQAARTKPHGGDDFGFVGGVGVRGYAQGPGTAGSSEGGVGMVVLAAHGRLFLA